MKNGEEFAHLLKRQQTDGTLTRFLDIIKGDKLTGLAVFRAFLRNKQRRQTHRNGGIRVFLRNRQRRQTDPTGGNSRIYYKQQNYLRLAPFHAVLRNNQRKTGDISRIS
jgi:hypothetical protein